MSPEQVRGQELDRRSDIFNFGLILYEMLAGTRAFRGDTTADVTSAILKESPPDLPESVPAALRQIVSVCLEKSPVNRFESARDIGFALRALSAGTSITTALPKAEEEAGAKRFWKRAFPLALAVTTVAAIVFALLYLLRRPEPLDLSAYKYTPFATEAARETNAAWSPDGKSIAYLKQINKSYQLMVRSLDAPSPTRLTNARSLGGLPFWSPEGDTIFYISDRKLWSVGVAGGQPRLIAPTVWLAAALSPDGNTLVFWNVTEEKGQLISSLWISSQDGSPPRKYEPAPFEFRGEYSPVFVRFSPDGSKIALSTTGQGAVFWLLDWPDGAKSKQRRVFSGHHFSWTPYFDWLPDSRRVIIGVKGNGLWLGDTSTGKLRRITAIEGAEHILPSVSPDGRRIAFTTNNEDYDILEIPLDGSSPRPFLATARREFSPSRSQAGDRMVYITDKSGAEEIWLRSASGEWERPIVTKNDFPSEGPLSFNYATLSPDGTRLAYTSPVGKVYISSTSGGKPMQAVPGLIGTEGGPSWSPDGASLVLSVYTDRLRWAVVRIGGREPPLYLTDPPSGRPIWSPDGRWIAGGKGYEVILVSPDLKTARKLPTAVNMETDDHVMVWSADSSILYIATSNSESAKLYALDIKTEKTVQVSDLGPDIEFRFYLSGGLSACLAPHGKSIISTVRVQKADIWILEGF
jgi:Tol biopolymer transport system component